MQQPSWFLHRMRTTAFLQSPLPKPAVRGFYRRRLTSLAPLNPTKLRDIYTIEEPPDILRAASAARLSASNFCAYLQARPVAEHTRLAFESALHWRSRHAVPRPLCIDSGCGSGRSTARLARLLPDCDVIGVDKSEVRLERTLAFRKFGGVPAETENALLLRADLVDFWRLCLEHGLFPEYHFILYPNPYPKPKNFKRRWHGHAIFPAIVALGGRVELRASWESYLHEFGTAFEAAHHTDVVRALRRPDHDQLSLEPIQQLVGIQADAETLLKQPLTNFEAKYVQIDQPIYQLCLDTRNAAARAGCALRGL